MSGRKCNCRTTCQCSQIMNILIASVEGLLVITHFLSDYKPLDVLEWKERCSVTRVNKGTCQLMSKSRHWLFCISDATEFSLSVLRSHCHFAHISPAIVPILSFSSGLPQKFLKSSYWIRHWILCYLTGLHGPGIFNNTEHLIFSWENSSKYSYTQLGV